MEEHITTSHFISGVIISGTTLFGKADIEVRYSKSNIADTISFSDNSTCMFMMKAEDLKRILDAEN